MNDNEDIANVTLINKILIEQKEIKIEHRQTSQVIKKPLEKSKAMKVKDNEPISIYGLNKDFKKERLWVEVTPKMNLWFQFKKSHPDKQIWELRIREIKQDNDSKPSIPDSRPRDISVTVGDPE